MLAFPEARRCPADRPITGGEKKCPINPLSPPDSDHFPANSAFPRGMTIPRDMDRSQMLREGRMPVPRGMPSPPYPGSIYRPKWDPSSSNTTKIFWGRHIMLSCPSPSPRPGTALLPPPPRGLYTTRKSTTNPFSDGRMKLRTARLDKHWRRNTARHAQHSRIILDAPSLCASHLPPACSRLPEARDARVLRSTRKLPK